LRKGSKYVPKGKPCELTRPPYSMIFECCIANDIENVRAWLESGYVKIHTRNARTGRGLLHEAVAYGLVDMVKMLVEDFHANVHQTTTLGHETPLHLAVAGGHRHLVFYLLSRGADPSTVNKYKMNCLFYAERKSIASQIISNGASFLQRNEFKKLPTEWIADFNPHLKNLIRDLKEKYEEEEKETFQYNLKNKVLPASLARVEQIAVARMKQEKARREKQFLERKTLEYLRWRRGEKIKR